MISLIYAEINEMISQSVHKEMEIVFFYVHKLMKSFPLSAHK